MSRPQRAAGRVGRGGCPGAQPSRLGARRGRGAFVVGIVLAGIGLSAAWGEDFPLKVRPLTQEELELVPLVSASPSPDKPKGVTAEPTYKGILPPRYFRMPLGKGSLTLAFDCSDPKARRYDVVYMDRRGDGKLVQEARVRATEKQASPLVSFEPVMVEVPFAGGKGKGMVQVRAFISGEQLVQAFVVPATCLEGTVRLGTQEYRLTLVDGNLSGVLGDGEGARCADLLLIDLNGNRSYDARATSSTREVRPLSECWQVGTNWWSATVAKDWSAVTVKPVKVAYGELRCSGAQVLRLTLTSRRYGVFQPTFKEGVPKVPLGEYAVEQMQVVATDAQKRPWQLIARGQDEKGLLKVAADAPAELDLSKPIVGTVEADTRSAGQAQFSLVLLAAGQQVAGLSVAGSPPGEPTFSIRDSAGKEVATGKFQYG